MLKHSIGSIEFAGYRRSLGIDLDIYVHNLRCHKRLNRTTANVERDASDDGMISNGAEDTPYVHESRSFRGRPQCRQRRFLATESAGVLYIHGLSKVP